MRQTQLSMLLRCFPDTPELIQQADDMAREKREDLKNLVRSEDGMLSELLK